MNKPNHTEKTRDGNEVYEDQGQILGTVLD